VLLYAFFEVPDWPTELRERHQLFADILRLAQRLGVDFAFPTQTVHLEQTPRDAATPPAPVVPATSDPALVGVDQAAAIFRETYGTDPPPRKPVVIDTKPRSRDTKG